jgi:hypothetical protein
MANDDLAPSELDGDQDAYTVRPYAVTGGRVETEGLAVETLVTTLDAGKDVKGLTPEKKKILKLAGDDYMSVAELSAHCRLPLGVIRILVTELSDNEYLQIHANRPAAADEAVDENSGITLSLLESVLDGIAAL